MSQRELEEAAKKNDSEPPVLDKLVVACPDFEFARVAVSSYGSAVGKHRIKAEMVVLPPGKNFDPTFHAICFTSQPLFGNRQQTSNGCWAAAELPRPITHSLFRRSRNFVRPETERGSQHTSGFTPFDRLPSSDLATLASHRSLRRQSLRRRFRGCARFAL